MKNLVIVGVGGFARTTYVNAINSVGYGSEYLIKGFLDGTVKLSAEAYEMLPLPVIGNVKEYIPADDDVFIVAIGYHEIRRQIVAILSEKQVQYVNVISKSAFVDQSAVLGKGIIVSRGCDIGSNAIIGDHVLMNLHSIVGRDASIGAYTDVMSGVDVTAWVHVGENVLLGSGSRIYPRTVIGDSATVGIGSVVIGNVKSGITVFGNPAVPMAEVAARELLQKKIKKLFEKEVGK